MTLDLWTDRSARFLLRLRNRHFFILDLILFAFLPFVALYFRIDDAVFEARYFIPLCVYIATTLPIWVGVFLLSGVYTRYWQYASIGEMGTILKASIAATFITAAVFFVVLRPLSLVPESFPRLMPFLVGLLTLFAVGVTRYSVRYMDRARRQRQFAGRSHTQVAVYGAGEAGAMIVREMQANPQLGLNPVAFFDDDASKYRAQIYGVPVVGGRNAIDETIRDLRVQEVIIAMPTATGKTIRELAALLMGHQLTVKTVPGMYELLDGSVTVNKLRNVEIDDLLRRMPVAGEPEDVVALVQGKRVLVTGAGGSIGGELCRQIARCSPAQLILLGHGENSIFFQGNELAASFPEVPLASVIADVRDAPRIDAVMARFKPDLVFHAAAHKHVSLMEGNVEDAVSNNVLGTRTVLDAALENDVGAFVMISTDKAVNPVSIMGATKRVAELYVHARALETGRPLMAVRFGNVLGSRGSVVPLFKQQIANGGPVRVTHPDVRRFFMTIPEAVQLVLQAATLGKGGEIFALDMGEPVRIVDLASDLIRLSGLEVGKDIDIEFTGLRPGEKLFEELFVAGEEYERTRREKIYVARNGIVPPRDEHARLYRAVDELIARAQAGDGAGVRTQLRAIVPEFGERAGMNHALAIDGGTPTRASVLPFNAPFIGEEEIAEVVDTLQSGWITTGPKTKQFEREFAEYVGAKHTVALNSCTAGLHLSLVVHGIGAGDEVIVPALTFGATANVVEHLGARPVIVDVDPDTLVLTAETVERARTPRTRAVMAVHYAGLPCELDALQAVADAHELVLIEDAAHAIGARYGGRMIGGISALTNFSFYANKNLSTAEGGMVTTNDDALEEKLRVAHLHGLSRDAWKRYHVKTYAPPEIVTPGYKYNMTDITASLGLHQLRRQEGFLTRREELAAYYDAAFAALDGMVRTQPRPTNGTRHALHFYPLLVDLERVRVGRNQLLDALLAENIGVSMHFQPLHMMPYYRDTYGYKPDDLPHARRIGESEISLPLQPQMSDVDAESVVEAVGKVLRHFER